MVLYFPPHGLLRTVLQSTGPLYCLVERESFPLSRESEVQLEVQVPRNVISVVVELYNGIFCKTSNDFSTVVLRSTPYVVQVVVLLLRYDMVLYSLERETLYY
jgi:hypothetical protein